MDDKRIIQSLTFVLPAENVDTDQIYPARFLTTTDREGLGEHCFRDWRKNPESRYFEYFQEFDPNQQQVLVSGRNFGCGSSREHAAWALLDAGFRAVISTSFGDIFHNNALNNGLLLVQVDQATLDFLMQHDRHAIQINIASAALEIDGRETVSFPLDEFAAYCLLHGIDGLDFLLGLTDQITQFEDHGASHT